MQGKVGEAKICRRWYGSMSNLYSTPAIDSILNFLPACYYYGILILVLTDNYSLNDNVPPRRRICVVLVYLPNKLSESERMIIRR